MTLPCPDFRFHPNNRENYKRNIALWIRHCSLLHSTICSCSSYKSHFQIYSALQKTQQKETLVEAGPSILHHLQQIPPRGTSETRGLGTQHGGKPTDHDALTLAKVYTDTIKNLQGDLRKESASTDDIGVPSIFTTSFQNYTSFPNYQTRDLIQFTSQGVEHGERHVNWGSKQYRNLLTQKEWLDSSGDITDDDIVDIDMDTDQEIDKDIRDIEGGENPVTVTLTYDQEGCPSPTTLLYEHLNSSTKDC